MTQLEKQHFSHPTSEYNDRNRRQAPDISVNKRFESCYPTAHARKGPHPSHLRLVFHIDKIRRFQWKFGSERPRGSEVSVTKRASSGDQSLQQCPTLQQQKPSEFRESPWINLEQNWKLIASKCRRRQTNWKPTWRKFSEKIRLLRESPGTKTRSKKGALVLWFRTVIHTKPRALKSNWVASSIDSLGISLDVTFCFLYESYSLQLFPWYFMALNTVIVPLLELVTRDLFILGKRIHFDLQSSPK